MLEFIEGRDDVLAVTVSGKLTGTDLSAVMDRLEHIMANHDTVHIFTETRTFTGIEVSELPSYFARAFPLFGKLHRFGRVAVVADQAWVRTATRVESAVLPGITYRTFEPEQRDEALQWVMDAPTPG
jgi:hypothetical protein